jgi:hypothetical protein
VKKLLALLLVAGFLATVVGCGAETKSSTTKAQTSTGKTSTEKKSE